MPYVDEKYYEETFYGEPVSDADFPSLCQRAEELVEEMTMYRLTPLTFPAMSEDVQELVKRAVCAQIEYLDANGGSDLDNGVGLQSAALGKFSYTAGTGSGSGSATQSVFSPRAQRYLYPTGLLYRGGGCL